MHTFPKVESIIDELRSRLKTAFPRMHIQRGFAADEVTTFPSIYIMEGEEESEKSRTKRRGMYERRAYITVSYFLKGEDNSDPSETLIKANQVLYDLYGAVETDELFNNLCTDYSVDNVVKVFYKTNAVQLAVTYEFAYTEFAPWANPKQRRT